MIFTALQLQLISVVKPSIKRHQFGQEHEVMEKK